MGVRHQYRRLALLVVALAAAAALVAVPLVVRASHTAPASCLGPDDPGVVSVGEGVGSGVMALTVRRDSTAALTASLRTASAPVPISKLSTLWVSGPGSSPVGLTRRTVGCWQGAVARSALASLSVRAGTSGATPVLAQFALPTPLASGDAIVARARQATLALPALREHTLGRSFVLETPRPVDTLYAGQTVVSRSSYGVDRFSWPGWRAGFAWVTPGLHATVILGRGRAGGVPVVTVAGAVVQTPLWIVLEIDAATGVVLGDQMNGPNHLMTNTYDPIGR